MNRRVRIASTFLLLLATGSSACETAEAGWFSDAKKKAKKTVKKTVKETKKTVKKTVKKTGKELKRTGKKIENGAEHLREETLDRLAHKVEKKASDTSDKLSKARRSLADSWNRFREKSVDPVGDAIALTYYGLKDGRSEFPPAYPRMEPRRVPSRGASVHLEKAFANSIVSELTRKTVPLDRRNPTSNNYLQPGNVQVQFDGTRRVIVVKGRDGMLGLEAVKPELRGGLRLNGYTIELFPTTRKEDGTVYLDLAARFTYLDLDDTPPIVERAIAHGVHRALLNKGPLATIDLRKSLHFSLPFVNNDEVLNYVLEDAGIEVTDDGISLTVNFSKK